MTLKSMTAYGRATSSEKGELTVEIQTLNRRHLEVVFSLPPTLQSLEVELRRRVTQRVKRGHVHIRVHWQPEGGVQAVQPNLPLARTLFEAGRKLEAELGTEGIATAFVLSEPGVLIHEEREGEVPVAAVLVDALEQAVQMREQEGAALAQELRTCLHRLQRWLQEIEAQSPQMAQQQREKLSKRLEELFAGDPENEERLLKEAALFAERVDIAEEIVRFQSHLEQIEKEIGGEGRGKTLDFLLQELVREANTMGAKVTLPTLAHLIVACKAEVEKMREQVQNVE